MPNWDCFTKTYPKITLKKIGMRNEIPNLAKVVQIRDSLTEK